jgi:hypothetical protein
MMPDWAFNWHSGIHAYMQVHCPGPCRMTKSVLRVYVHAACPCSYCMPCPGCMFMSMLHSMSMQHSMSMWHSMSMLHVYVYVHVHICRNARMPDCPASGQYGTGLKKTTDARTGLVRTKLTQSSIFLVRYWTKIRDAGMPMPALASSMLMPSYDLK